MSIVHTLAFSFSDPYFRPFWYLKYILFIPSKLCDHISSEHYYVDVCEGIDGKEDSWFNLDEQVSHLTSTSNSIKIQVSPLHFIQLKYWRMKILTKCEKHFFASVADIWNQLFIVNIEMVLQLKHWFPYILNFCLLEQIIFNVVIKIQLFAC